MNTRYVLLLLVLGTATISTNLLQASAPTPATWACRTCTFANKSATGKCEVCDTAKPLMQSAPVAAAHQAWSCSACTAVNWPDSRHCEICYTQRPVMRTAPRADDAAFAARLQEEEMRYDREETERRAARERERIAGEVAAKRAAEEAATQAAIAKIQAADEADERSRRAATTLAAQFAAEEAAERLNRLEADAALARALAEADDARRAQEEAATHALIAQITGTDAEDAHVAQVEADHLLALRLEAEEVAQAARLNQGAARAAAEINDARRRGEVSVITAVPRAARPVPLAPATICPAPPLLPNTTGTCFMNAMLHCLFSSSRLIDPIRALGATSPVTAALNNVLAAYCAHSVPEGLLLALHQQLLTLLPADHARTGGDSSCTYQVLADELHRLNPAFNNNVIHLGLPDQNGTPVSINQLIEYYNLSLKHYAEAGTRMYIHGKLLEPIDVNVNTLNFCIARPLPGHALNTKPVILEPEITVQGARFRLTGCACHVPGHAYAQKRAAAGWFACDDNRFVTAIPEATVTNNNTQAYLVIYERI